MRALFLADAHLSKPSDPNYRTLLAFLEEQCGKTDQLILLGDIFEFWIGKTTVVADYAPLIDALERMHQQGTKLVYVEGNHDFHLGRVFTDRLSCQVFPDGGSIDLDGKKVFIAHGDLANPDDAGYRCLRKFLRSSLIRTLLRIVPNSLIMAIANRGSDKSRKSYGVRRNRWPVREILKPYAEAILAAGHQAVVTGHFHQPFHEKLGDGELIALGDWITQYSYAVYEDHVFTLKSYPATPPSIDSIS
ncbi:MAG: UDP-2,3-diacylglucosamine diphosphatase [Desulfuromonadales bacterium]|nr:UDP-2,3-diacylglucosamine diphosphatase [Desulfuromonadales bacterium]